MSHLAVNGRGVEVGAERDGGCAQAAMLPLPCADADRTTSYAYDAVGNRVAMAVTDGALGEESVAFAYDAASQLVAASGPEGETAYAYDAAGRRSSHQFQPPGVHTIGLGLGPGIGGTLGVGASGSVSGCP